MWRYKSPVGDIHIKKMQNGNYGTIHDGIVWEECDTPQAAADNVFSRATGCEAWDLYEFPSNVADNTPNDLSEWEKY